jgi:hypothetical protein
MGVALEIVSIQQVTLLIFSISLVAVVEPVKLAAMLYSMHL